MKRIEHRSGVQNTRDLDKQSIKSELDRNTKEGKEQQPNLDTGRKLNNFSDGFQFVLAADMISPSPSSPRARDSIAA